MLLVLTSKLCFLHQAGQCNMDVMQHSGKKPRPWIWEGFTCILRWSQMARDIKAKEKLNVEFADMNAEEI